MLPMHLYFSFHCRVRRANLLELKPILEKSHDEISIHAILAELLEIQLLLPIEENRSSFVDIHIP